MFTGIVEEKGRVKKISSRSGVMLLEISAAKTLEGASAGDSICVSGACLTIAALTRDTFSFEVMHQSRADSNLAGLRAGQEVNLERSLKAGDKIGGHFVYGHVDCVGIIRSKILRSGTYEFEIAVDPSFIRYCLPKGSVAVEGISLTLGKIKGASFTVNIIPHTLKNTTLGQKMPADKVNIEFDMLAKSSLQNNPSLLRK